LIKEILGLPIRTEVGSFPRQDTDTGFWVADTTRAREALGWSASHDLRGGLADTVAWFRGRREVRSAC
jgi:nucleoside-diphosphate-sugar epimerase